jgi:branched-chain amino acid transport system substrate-binding protein
MYSGPIKFDATGQNTGAAVAVLQAKESKPHVVGPEGIAEYKPQYPLMPFEKR